MIRFIEVKLIGAPTPLCLIVRSPEIHHRILKGPQVHGSSLDDEVLKL